MIPEIGHFLLVTALVLACIQASTLLIPKLRIILKITSLLQSMVILLSFACLIISYIESDFSVINVYLNSHSAKPMLYKISASWGNHEGSMLLWISVLSAYGLWLSLTNTKQQLKPIRDSALGVQAILQIGFISFIIFTSNPFIRQFPIPDDGQGLNPLLQDIGLALHPPLLYAGYVGFGIMFSLGIAALIKGKADREFASYIHPFIMLPWIFLTLGISMGSWWAYRELGWGGWWFWDAVENASLLPWLAGTALLHANLVLAKKGKFGEWVTLLAIITFSLSMIGTFLVRSGIVTSVHSFANDPARGVFILAFLGAVTGLSLLLYAIRLPKLSSNNANDEGASSKLNILSKEGSILINSLFMVAAAATILLATLYPIMQELFGSRSVTVGAPYFNKTFFPLLAPAMIICGISMMVPWGKGSSKLLKKKAKLPLLVTIICVLLASIFLAKITPWLIIGVGIGTWLIVAAKQIFWKAIGFPSAGLITSIKNISTAPRGVLAVSFAHGAVGLFIISIAFSSQLKTSYIVNFSKINEVQEIGDYSVTLRGYREYLEHNYISRKADILITNKNNFLSPKHISLEPEKRFFPIHGKDTAEAAIDSGIFEDRYAVIREIGKRPAVNPDNITDKKPIPPITVEIFFTPLMLWLWVSMLFAAFSGMIALRRI